MKASFDIEANDYDENFTFSRIGRDQRNRVWRYVDKLLLNSSGKRILELNCGTGEDAVHFAKNGCQVVATDLSEKMIERTETKIAGHTLKNNIVTNILDLKSPELSQGEKYDFIFSNFGGLNCISKKEMLHLAEFLFPYLRKGGHCIFVIMPPFTLIEKWFRICKRQSDIYNQRSEAAPLKINVGGELVTTHFHSEYDAKIAFNIFKHVRTIPVGFIPSYLEKSKFYWLLNWIEKFAFATKIHVDKADHYLIHFQKY